MVHLRHITGVERRQAVHHLVRDHAQTPPVHTPAIVLLPEYLRGQVLGGTTEGSGGVSKLEVLLAKAKVREDNVPLGVQ